MRARNIKPGLFKNEILGTGDPLLTILFAGLWCLADRDGRLEDRPLRIKAEVFPYREKLDVNYYLTKLSQLGFIRRYTVDSQALIHIINFSKHQNPHHTERKSTYPSPVSSPLPYGEVTVSTPQTNGGSPADLLIPDSLIHNSLATRTDAPSKPNSKHGTGIMSDFTAKHEHRELAKELGLDADAERPAFIDHHQANGTIQADWDAAFRKWLRKAHEFSLRNRINNFRPEATLGMWHTHEPERTIRLSIPLPEDLDREAGRKAWNSAPPSFQH